eukprot:CAMPEP_0183702368 /NCGR_PEP_ID=MMETSP0737-20130205/495_1 /TAXON_ID=385413 /ORGANISM="Thalassiosira miniscula, Strain CCMP1093" /LENGTH=134 /DNA_ID=CAMNT_0025928965 /DNA_START=293 /DNA_END=694 /DNA_ORIENTATION=-
MIKDSRLLNIKVLIITPRAPFSALLDFQMEFIVPLRRPRHDIARLPPTLILRPDDNVVHLSVDGSGLLPGRLVDVIAIVAELVCLRAGDGIPPDDNFEEVFFALYEIAGFVIVLLYASGSGEPWSVGGRGAACE